MANTPTNHLPGPLAVSKTNPRYFSVKDKDGQEQAVYLTGSHIWNNFQDGLGPGKEAMPDKPEQNDFEAYLTFLKGRNHNFIRLWRWEHFKSNAGVADFHLNMSPQPWPEMVKVPLKMASQSLTCRNSMTSILNDYVNGLLPQASKASMSPSCCLKVGVST